MSRQLAFPGAPPAWVIVLVIVPLLVLFVGSIYRREGESASPRAKLLLGALRFAATHHRMRARQRAALDVLATRGVRSGPLATTGV